MFVNEHNHGYLINQSEEGRAYRLCHKNEKCLQCFDQKPMKVRYALRVLDLGGTVTLKLNKYIRRMRIGLDCFWAVFSDLRQQKR